MEQCQIPASFVIGRSENSYTISDHDFTNCRTNNDNNNNNKYVIINVKLNTSVTINKAQNHK
jgi:hypothetical protein